MFNFNTSKRPLPADNNLQDNPYAQGAEMPAQGGNDLMEQRIQEIEAQRAEFMAKKPDFDIKAELQNRSFATYLFKNGLSVEEAYTLVHQEEIIAEAVRDAFAKLSARQNRIAENGVSKSSPASVKKNPKDMTDKEIDSIIERVKNGEKIVF